MGVSGDQQILKIVAVIATNNWQYWTTCSLPDQGSKKSLHFVVVNTSSASNLISPRTNYQQISTTSTLQFCVG